MLDEMFDFSSTIQTFDQKFIFLLQILSLFMSKP